MEQSPTWLTLTTHANIGTVLHRKLRCVRLLHRVLDCINCWFGPQVVHAGLKRMLVRCGTELQQQECFGSLLTLSPFLQE